MAAAAKAVSSRSLALFADLVEAEARRHTARPSPSPAAADQLVRAFRGGATPEESVGQFLNRVYRAGWVEGPCFVLAGVYLCRFLRSRAAVAAGVRVDPATAHRLAAVALYVGTKFGGHTYNGWTGVFEVCSGHTIRVPEMLDLERRFLRAIDYRLYVRSHECDAFVRFMLAGPPKPTRPPARAPPDPAPEPVARRRGGKRKADGDRDGKHHRARRVRPCLPTTAGAARHSVIASN